MKEKSYANLLPDFQLDQIKELLQGLDSVARTSIMKTLIGKDVEECAITYSGGIDSSILANLILKGIDQKIVSISVGRIGSRDQVELEAARDGNSNSDIFSFVDDEHVKHAARDVVTLLGSKVGRITHLEDCVAFLLIGRELKQRKPKAKYLITANGPDELYCGYDRYRRIYDTEGKDVTKSEISRAVDEARDLKRKVGLVLKDLDMSTLDPFMTDDFVFYGLDAVPLEAKLLKGDDRLRKRLWRAYGRSLGLPESIVLRPKKAMQYSMGLHSVVNSMVKSGELIMDSKNDEPAS